MRLTLVMVTRSPGDCASSWKRTPATSKHGLQLAAHYKKAGSPELAIEHYRLAAERFPDSQKVALLLAEAMTGDGHTRDALQLLERFAERKAPESSEVPSWIGILRDELGDLKSAESAHRLALSFAPYSALLHNNLGYNLLLQGHHEDAAKEFSEALKISPRYELARNNMGVALASRPQAQTGGGSDAVAVSERSGDGTQQSGGDSDRTG